MKLITFVHAHKVNLNVLDLESNFNNVLTNLRLYFLKLNEICC